MKKILAGIMSSALVFGSAAAPTFADVADSITISASAAEITAQGECGENVTWTLDSEGTLTISGEGDMYNYSVSTIPWDEYRDSIKNVVIEKGVLSIGSEALYDCAKLTSITLPDSVTSIGDSAFSRCDSLTDITIPDGVTSIGNLAFWNCSSLTSIIIPESITSIGVSAFSGTPWLEAKREENPLFIVNNILIDGKNCEGDVVIPDGVTSIGIRAFFDCIQLESVTLPDSVTSICSGAFYYCRSLKSITILNPDCEIFDSEKTISDTAVIRGYENSTVQAFAEKYEYKFESLGEAPSAEVKGDVDGDGKIAISDATMTLTIYANKAAGNSLNAFTEAQIKAADVNGDGSINIADATEILKIYAESAVGR